ncbi:MAG: hypothetical protein OXH76_20140 [Boseongicola sp.]|nr:hypothetical protein [Boseongicola sp.]
MTGVGTPPRHLSISATDAEWDTVRDHAARRGLPINRYLVGLVERDRRERDGSAPIMALNPAEQRELLEGVREIRTLLGGRGNPAPLLQDMQDRVAVRFAVWAGDMLESGREEDLRAALVAVRGERQARADMARLARGRGRDADHVEGAPPATDGTEGETHERDT